MSRAALIALTLGALGLLATALLGIGGGRAVMPSYLAAWLFWSALPIGALPVLMTLDLLGRGEAVAAFVRPLLVAWPAVVVLALPLLFGLAATYPWVSAPSQAGFAGHWLRAGPFIVRWCVYLAIWLALALLFALPRAAGKRRAAATVGLMLHAVIGTLAAFDWSMSVDPGWHSTTYGLLFVMAQVAAAGAAAVLIAAGLGLLAGVARQAHGLLLIPAAIWAFLAFVQFLIVWSGDLPDEIGYYISRGAGIGQATEWFLLVAGLLVPVAAAWTRRPRPLAIAAMLALSAHLVEMYWLVTPAFRGRFTISLADITAAIGVGGLVAGSAMLLARRSSAWRTLEVRHG